MQRPCASEVAADTGARQALEVTLHELALCDLFAQLPERNLVLDCGPLEFPVFVLAQV